MNSNPFGPPPGLLGYLNALDLAPYPDPAYPAAHAAVASHHSAEPKTVVLGGAAELTYRLSACYLKLGRSALVAAPGFGEYSRATELYGARVYHLNVYPRDAEPDADTLIQALQDARPTLVCLAQTNNPTGHAWGAEALEKIAETCRNLDALLVIDAAYLELRGAFQASLRRIGFNVWETCSSFFLVEVGDAAAFSVRAKGAGFRVRDASSFGLPGCVRLAAGRREDNETFLRWLALY